MGWRWSPWLVIGATLFDKLFDGPVPWPVLTEPSPATRFRFSRTEVSIRYGLESCFVKFGGVPEEVLFDNARALVVERDAATRTVMFNGKLTAFAKHWASGHGLRAISSPHQGQDR